MSSMPYRIARRIAIAIVGGTVLLIGMAMIVLPGPAIVVIPMGLGILGLEFAWARVWLKKLKAAGSKAMNSVKGNSTASKDNKDSSSKP